MTTTRNAKEIIAERYGNEGTKEREKFREDAFSYYFGEIIKNRRKELKLCQLYFLLNQSSFYWLL